MAYDKKLPITCYIAVKNGLPMLRNALEAVSFCDQIIIVDDRSVDGTYKCAKEFTDEIYLWIGSDSMQARRNFAIGFEGNDEIPDPEWKKYPEYKDNHPEIKNEWFFFVDHDEIIVQDPNLPPILEVFENIIHGDHGMKGGSFLLVNMEDKPGRIATQSPITRIFKKSPKVYWVRDIQNEQRHENPMGLFEVRLQHYGYSNQAYQVAKMWKRLPQLQKHVQEDPDNFARQMYVLNNITGMCQTNKQIDECMAYFQAITKHTFLASGQRNKADMQALMEACIRHYWLAMCKHKKFAQFISEIKDVYNQTKWIPDVPFWYFLAHEAIKDKKATVKYGKEFIKTITRYMADTTRNIELTCIHQRFVVPAILTEMYMEAKEHNKADKMDELAREWLS